MMLRLIFYGWMIYNYLKEMIYLAQFIKVLEGLLKLNDDGEEEGIIFSDEYMSQFDEAYDEDGDSVTCPNCGDSLYFKEAENTYVCLSCGYELERDNFLDYIGADVPGEECKTCDNLYPGCISCPYGYVDDDDEFWYLWD